MKSHGDLNEKMTFCGEMKKFCGKMTGSWRDEVSDFRFRV